MTVRRISFTQVGVRVDGLVPRLVVALLAIGGATTLADTYEERLASEAEQLQRVLKQRCPDRADEIAGLTKPMSAADRAIALARLAPCGKSEPLYHQTIGSTYLEANDFKAAEASYRKELALGVTEAGQAGLLMALARQSKLTTSQQTDLRKQLDYFHVHACTRDDICVGLAYVGWHIEDTALTRASADAAIALGFAGWQPYFFGGTAYAVPPEPDRAKARRLLLEAKKRGAPSDVEDMLRDLGAP
ncbi:MAG TPA: hypothetical protein VMJ10_18680 [Kofleriaceae bacterium]|nr:hypothetical protein [Kofleriaceae bacterium]